MLKKAFLSSVFLVFVFLSSGCTLIKGTGGAVSGFAKGGQEGVKEGLEEDLSFFKRADSWIKENLW